MFFGFNYLYFKMLLYARSRKIVVYAKVSIGLEFGKNRNIILGSSNEVRHSEPLFQNRLRQEVAFSNFRSKPNTVAILNFKALKEASVVDVASDSLGVKSTKADSFVDTVNKNVTGEAADQDAWEMEATTQNENEGCLFQTWQQLDAMNARSMCFVLILWLTWEPYSKITSLLRLNRNRLH